MKIEIVWKDNVGDSENKRRIENLFYCRRLRVRKQKGGLEISETPGEDNLRSMWYCLYLFTQCHWLRNEVKSCVWKYGNKKECVVVDH